jgi:ABC-type antimicrobial peptide transport system permease subunit
MALGASREAIYRLVFGQGAWQVGLGLFLGLTLALIFSLLGATMLQSALYKTSPRDPLTYLAVAGLLVVVSVLAMLVPARRAAKVDPMVALRAE